MFERKKEQPAIDARLVPYLEAQDAAAALRERDLLFSDYLEPMIGRAVRKQTRIRFWPGMKVETQAAADAADLFQDVAASIFERLEEVRRGESAPIANLNAFVQETAKNQFITYLGEKDPHRKKIRQGMYDYVERGRNSGGSIIMWRNGEGKVYSLPKHEGRAVEVNSNYIRLTQDPEGFKASHFSPEQLKRWRLSDGAVAVKGALIVELLQAILTTVDGPVEASRLEEAVVQMTGGDSVGRVTSELGREDEDEEPEDWWEEEATPVEATQIADTLGAQTIPVAWRHIRSLALSERRGRILKMEPDDLVLFFANGISEREMADAIEMPLEQFRRLRDTLPLSHREIEKLFPGHARTIENASSRAKRSLRETFGALFGLGKQSEE